MLEECGGCGTRFAPDLERCPHCGLERAEDGMPKITSAGVSFPEGEERVHPGYGVPMEGVEHPADGTWSPEVSNDEPAEDAQVPDAAPEPAPALPRVPPRLAPPEVPGG